MWIAKLTTENDRRLATIWLEWLAQFVSGKEELNNKIEIIGSRFVDVLDVAKPGDLS